MKNVVIPYLCHLYYINVSRIASTKKFYHSNYIFGHCFHLISSIKFIHLTISVANWRAITLKELIIFLPYALLRNFYLNYIS